MNFQRLLHSNTGIIFISILLGLGIASLFRKVCKDKTCIEFNGPILAEVTGKTFKHGEKCYQYKLETDTCKENIQTIAFKKREEDIPKILG